MAEAHPERNGAATRIVEASESRVIFSDTYAAEMVEELQRIVRTSMQLEEEKVANRSAESTINTNPPSNGHTPNGNPRSSPTTATSSAENPPQACLNHFTQQCQHIDTVRQLKGALHALAAKVATDLETLVNPPPPSSARSKTDRPTALPDKQFTACNSMLTDLLEVRHFRTIYNIFVVILLMLLLNTVVHDYVKDGSINVGLEPIRLGFRQFHLALLVWAQMQTMSASVFVGFGLWAVGRRRGWLGRTALWDGAACAAFVGGEVLLMAVAVRLLLAYDLPIVPSIAVLMELTRFLMKNHAFVRSNVPKVLSAKPKSTDDKPTATSSVVHQQLPTFGHFVYFQFAPTLVYRDTYPRTHAIRWSRVAWNALEVVGVIFYVSFIFERFLLQYFRPFGATGAGGMTAQSIVVAIFGCVLPAMMANLCGFYCLLHAWMNGWAELLRFADRQFYRDWWNASSYDVYYRTWNCVVHDWLYAYVYRDLYTVLAVDRGASRLVARSWATVAVFALSALFHEMVLAVAFRFFYPVLLVMFLGVGMMLSCVRLKRGSRLGNIFLWFSIALGNGLCMSLYCMEYFARVNCAVDEADWTEYVVPVSWRCNVV